jgi:hypothetical protein
MVIDERIIALAVHLKEDPASIRDTQTYGLYAVGYSGRQYYVLNDKEADQVADEHADAYVEEVVPEVPVRLRPYFDVAAYKEDIISEMGRGAIIAGYDGNEYEIGDLEVCTAIGEGIDNEDSPFFQCMTQEEYETSVANTEYTLYIFRVS